MKMVVCTLTIRLPLAALVEEGKTEEDVRAEFAGIKDELRDTTPDGAEVSLRVTTEEG